MHPAGKFVQKKCPCAVFTVYSKTSNHTEKIQTVFIFCLLCPALLERGGLWRPESSLTHLLGPERGFTPSSNPHTLCRHTLLPGKGNHLWSCHVVTEGMTCWFTPSPDLRGSANSLASPFLSFHLSWGCFALPSQRAFCCQPWQDWQEDVL